MEAAIDSVLSDHFENAENPHETIYRIWLLMNTSPLSNSMAATCTMLDDRKPFNVARTK